MNSDRIINAVGIAGLLICFTYSIVRIAAIEAAESDPNRIILKIAHTNLEPGLRESFVAVIQRYENLHPNITVKQLPVPERVYPIWMETKLFGENAPDIILIGPDAIGNEDLLGYFLPIGPYVEEPNPYNDSTDFKGVPWKDTFFDGLCCPYSYNTNLLTTFGVPVTIITTRVFYNQDLLRKIAGYSTPPETFTEFIELCRQVDEYRNATGQTVFALAGSEVNAYLLFRSLLGSQTQKLTYRMEPTNELNGLTADTTGAYLGGWWTLRDPEIVSGLRLVKEFSDFLTPGFQQLKRDDALFQFVQGHALMIVAQSKEARSIEMQAPFKVGVSQIPLPNPNNPEYGEFMLGPQSEANFGAQPAFGIYNRSKHTALALDFLQFLTSKEVNRIFSEFSGWLPSVIGIAPGEDIAPFMPQFEGYRIGFSLAHLHPNITANFKTNLHLLIGETGSVDQMIAAMEKEMLQAAKKDQKKAFEDVLRDAAYFDSMLGALWERNTSENGAFDSRISEILESQTYQEEVSSYRVYQLETFTAGR